MRNGAYLHEHRDPGLDDAIKENRVTYLKCSLEVLEKIKQTSSEAYHGWYDIKTETIACYDPIFLEGAKKAVEFCEKELFNEKMKDVLDE